MSTDKENALKKGLAEIWAALSSCSYGDISETMMTVSRAKAKCLALIDPMLLEIDEADIVRFFWRVNVRCQKGLSLQASRQQDKARINPT